MHLWGPGVKCVSYNDYPQNIKKMYSIDRIFNNQRCQVILWWQLKEPLCCICAIIWAQISWRVVRFVDSVRVPWLGHFCPQRNVSSMFSLVFSSFRWRSKSATHKQGQVWSGTCLSKSSQTCFSRQSTMLWSMKCTNNVSFRIWHLILLNNSIMSIGYGTWSKYFDQFSTYMLNSGAWETHLM